MFVCFSGAGFLLLVFFPAPAALGKFLYASLLDDAWPQAVMGFFARFVKLAITQSLLANECKKTHLKMGCWQFCWHENHSRNVPITSKVRDAALARACG